MKTLLKIVGVILLLCIALIIAAPFLIPTDTIFNKVSEQVEKTTGRTLTIKGDKTLSVFPALKLELNDVHFANMQTGSRDDMASMEQLAVHIPWLSLFGGEFKLDKFVINEPNILLETDTLSIPVSCIWPGLVTYHPVIITSDSPTTGAKRGGDG